MTYLCWKAEGRNGTTFGAGSLVVAGSVSAAARAFAEGYGEDHFLVVVVEESGQKWHVDAWTEVALGEPEKVAP